MPATLLLTLLVPVAIHVGATEVIVGTAGVGKIAALLKVALVVEVHNPSVAVTV